jgi:hypothetical protein
MGPSRPFTASGSPPPHLPPPPGTYRPGESSSCSTPFRDCYKEIPKRSTEALCRLFGIDLPSQSFGGPEQVSPPIPDSLEHHPAEPRKRKRTSTPEYAEGSDHETTSEEEEDEAMLDPNPSPSVRFGRKNSAYDVWAFVRPAQTREDIPDNQWPKDYDILLTSRPHTPFIGCKLCTQFG